MNKNIILSWLAVFLWMTLIFALSSQPASMSNLLSKKAADIIIRTADRTLGDSSNKPQPNRANKVNNQVRDYAHAGLYMILALLMINAIRNSNVGGFKVFILVFILCSIYAFTDEIHQMFVPGRGVQVQDFLIDCAGAIAGLWIYFIISLIDRNMKKHKIA